MCVDTTKNHLLTATQSSCSLNFPHFCRRLLSFLFRNFVCILLHSQWQCLPFAMTAADNETEETFLFVYIFVRRWSRKNSKIEIFYQKQAINISLWHPVKHFGNSLCFCTVDGSVAEIDQTNRLRIWPKLKWQTKQEIFLQNLMKRQRERTNDKNTLRTTDLWWRQIEAVANKKFFFYGRREEK